MASTYEEKELVDNIGGSGIAAEYSGYAVRASKDENGNNIMSTYATKEAVDGKANKLVPASANNLAALDTNGQLTEVGLTLVNNSITAIGGKTITGTESVFVAIYNSTRGDAITAALNSGKVVISVYYDGSIGFVTYQDKNNHKYGFTCVRKISNQLGQTPGTIQFGGWFCNGAGNSWFGQHSSLVLPAPGSNDIGKVLTAYKDNTNSGNYRLETINRLPSSTSSDEGKLLTVNSEGTPSWEEPTKELPPVVAGDEDKFLRVSTSGVPAWDNPFEKSSWGTVITDTENNPMTDEQGNPIFDENKVDLWTTLDGVGIGAERAAADVEGNPIVDTYAKKSEVPDVSRFQQKLITDTVTATPSVNVDNNTVTSITINAGDNISAMTINCNISEGDCPNLAVEIDNQSSTDCTITVIKNNVADSLKMSAATDGVAKGGKFYQLTCVGRCWTMAEFN